MDVFSICEFATPAEGGAQGLSAILKAGMPVNVRVGDIRAESPSSDILHSDPRAGMLHVVVATVDPKDEEQVKLAGQLIDRLLEFGANWLLLDGQNRTPGCICVERGLPKELYERFVRAGVRSEIFLQRMTEPSSEISGEEFESAAVQNCPRTPPQTADAGLKPESQQTDYFASKLKYGEHTLKTSQDDGVMMDWETPIMKRSAEIVAGKGKRVLNIGFGMGIIDGFIQNLEPASHYIVEAHPDVLAKMREDGWYERPNVVVIEGPWRTELPKLIDNGVTFDGIYYDTFSEHYSDMLDLFDLICGLLEFDGTFSFFNGLGADRQICYDVYREVVAFDVQDHGLEVQYEEMDVSLPKDTWEGLKRSYFKLSKYALPIIQFMA